MSTWQVLACRQSQCLDSVAAAPSSLLSTVPKGTRQPLCLILVRAKRSWNRSWARHPEPLKLSSLWEDRPPTKTVNSLYQIMKCHRRAVQFSSAHGTHRISWSTPIWVRATNAKRFFSACDSLWWASSFPFTRKRPFAVHQLTGCNVLSPALSFTIVGRQLKSASKRFLFFFFF